MEETVESAVSLWNKKYADLTVGETVVATSVMMAAVIAAPVAVIGTLAAMSTVYDKIRGLKKTKKTELEVVTPEVS